MSHLVPKQDRLLLVLDTEFNLWDLVIDAFGAHETVESVIVTDEFLKLLSPAQTREMLIAISQLSKLRIVQIDFPAGTSHPPVVRQSQSQSQSEISDNDTDSLSTTSTSNTNSSKEEVDASIMAGVVWLVKRAKGLTSLRLHNIDAVKTTLEFNDAVAKHPCLKDVKIVGGEEGFRSSYRSQRTALPLSAKSLSEIMGESPGTGTQQQAQTQGNWEEARRISLTGIRHERALKHGRSRAGSVIIREGRGRSPIRARVPVEPKQTAEYHANVRRRIKKAISKDKSKELEDESPEYDLDERRQSGLSQCSSGSSTRKHGTLQRRVSRSESPRSRRHKYLRHHNHHKRRRSYSESPKGDLDRDANHSGHFHHKERATKYHRSSLTPVTEGGYSIPPQVEEKMERANRRRPTSMSPNRSDRDADFPHRGQATVPPTTKFSSNTSETTRVERTKSEGRLDDLFDKMAVRSDRSSLPYKNSDKKSERRSLSPKPGRRDYDLSPTSNRGRSLSPIGSHKSTLSPLESLLGTDGAVHW